MNSTDAFVELRDKSQLIDWFRAGIKPEKDWGIGTEHELFLFSRKDFKRLPYDGQPGIKGVLKEIQKDGWNPILENNNIVGLAKDGTTITLEPGGQFELSGANNSTIHQTFEETRYHFECLKTNGEKLGFYHLHKGFDPFSRRDEVFWMPKERYRFMKSWMPAKGDLGLDMMLRTSSIQVNLDYSSEADMIQKMQVAQAFQPVVTAMFANSPFTEGKPNGYLTYRAYVWDNTDNERCGFMHFVFDDDFGFERWIDFLLEVPMYFIFREGRYYSAEGMTFKDFMEGKHGYKPTIDDWEMHVSTVFPDIRLKKFIELRGADAGSVEMITALAAFWTGIFYDTESLSIAHGLIKEIGLEALYGLRAKVPEDGLKAECKSVSLSSVAQKLLALSSEGLARRASKMGIVSEQKYLHVLETIIACGQTDADRLLNLYSSWGDKISTKEMFKVGCGGQLGKPKFKI